MARGGGSIEDLWGFNEEIVARATAASDIPLISAVGHETDTTLIDSYPTRRAPTPTAAAEMAVPVRLDLLVHLDKQNARLSAALSRGLQVRRQRMRDLSRALPRPDELTRPAAQRLDLWSDRLPRALTAMVQVHRTRLAGAAAVLRPATLAGQQKYDRTRLARADERLRAALVRTVERRRLAFTRHGAALRMKAAVAAQMTDLRGALRAADRLHESLSHKATLARGYAIARAEGAVVTTASDARSVSVLTLQFHDGEVSVTPASVRKAASAPGREGGKQGSLFDE